MFNISIKPTNLAIENMWLTQMEKVFLQLWFFTNKTQNQKNEGCWLQSRMHLSIMTHKKSFQMNLQNSQFASYKFVDDPHIQKFQCFTLKNVKRPLDLSVQICGVKDSDHASLCSTNFCHLLKQFIFSTIFKVQTTAVFPSSSANVCNHYRST